MTEKCKAILKSLGTYPPIFIPDFNRFRNCYAHALNCMYEDRDYSVYTPGCISAAFNESDILIDDIEDVIFFDADLSIKLIKRDCSFLSISATCCKFDSKVAENAYKIAFAYSKADNDFHFIRQNADGLWSHKIGFSPQSGIIDYHGESHISLAGQPYKVIEIMQLQKIFKL